MQKDQYTEGIIKRFLQLKDEVMEQQHMTLKEFAASLGMFSQNFPVMERGERVPTIQQAAHACDLYGYSCDWLLRNAGPKLTEKELALPIEHRVQELELQMRMVQKLLKTRVTLSPPVNNPVNKKAKNGSYQR